MKTLESDFTAKDPITGKKVNPLNNKYLSPNDMDSIFANPLSLGCDELVYDLPDEEEDVFVEKDEALIY